MSRRFVTVDVFTDRMFGGNQLAVVLEAEGLTGAQMQSIAAEFNYAETTFVLPPRDPANTASIRIFTPVAEMPFAGHPNVGTGYVLARLGEAFGKPVGETLTFEEKAGLVAIRIDREGADPVGAEITAPKQLSVGDEVRPDDVAACIGLAVSDIDVTRHRPVLAGAGVDFVFAQAADRAVLAATRPNAAEFQRRLPGSMAIGVYFYAPADEDGLDFHARMFAPELGVTEDPATGSAAVAFAGLRAHLTDQPEGEFPIRVGQGYDLGRPSQMDAVAVKRDASVTETRVGGRCVWVMEGALHLD